MTHLTKTGFGQCKCLWCGKYQSHLPCPVSLEMRKALAAFATANGRTWKSKLRNAWTRGENLGQELQQCRNVIGPSGLEKVASFMIKRLLATPLPSEDE